MTFGTAIVLLVVGSGGRTAWFASGFLGGAFLIVVCWMISDRTHHLTKGSRAESWTSELLRRQRGWTVVDHVPMDGFDIDHVAITPAAVLAVETKYYGPSESVWPPPWHAKSVGQAADNAAHARALIVRSFKADVEVVPVLVLWGLGVPNDLTASRVGTVWIVNGSRAGDFVYRWTTPTIDPSLAANIRDKLQGFITRRDEYIVARGAPAR